MLEVRLWRIDIHLNFARICQVLLFVLLSFVLTPLVVRLFSSFSTSGFTFVFINVIEVLKEKLLVVFLYTSSCLFLERIILCLGESWGLLLSFLKIRMRSIKMMILQDKKVENDFHDDTLLKRLGIILIRRP